MAPACPAPLARKTGATMRATRLLSWRVLASRTQSRVRCTAQRCHAAPWNTSAIALLSPSWASEATSATPSTPRALMVLRDASQGSWDSVSTTESPRARRQPRPSQPKAVTTAVEAARPPPRHLT